MSRINLRHLLSADVTLGVRENSFSPVFREYLLRKDGFLGRVFVSRFVFFQRPSCQRLELCCSETTFAKQRLAFTEFWDNRFFFIELCLKLFEVKIVTLNFRRYLMIVVRLIFPDFATCSLTLNKHLVSAVVKWLSTSANLALSTLAPMFRWVEQILFPQGLVKTISFFSRVRDISRRFNSLSLPFSAPSGRILPIFV